MRGASQPSEAVHSIESMWSGIVSQITIRVDIDVQDAPVKE